MGNQHGGQRQHKVPTVPGGTTVKRKRKGPLPIPPRCNTMIKRLKELGWRMVKRSRIPFAAKFVKQGFKPIFMILKGKFTGVLFRPKEST